MREVRAVWEGVLIGDGHSPQFTHVAPQAGVLPYGGELQQLPQHAAQQTAPLPQALLPQSWNVPTQHYGAPESVGGQPTASGGDLPPQPPPHWLDGNLGADLLLDIPLPLPDHP